jgi:hypothetical protein
MVIYAIEVVTIDRFVKFGVALLYQSRLSTLQSSCPYELRLLGVADWPDEEEGRIHAFLEVDRIRGEWYKPSSRTDLVVALLVDPDGLFLWQEHATIPLSGSPTQWIECE